MRRDALLKQSSYSFSTLASSSSSPSVTFVPSIFRAPTYRPDAVVARGAVFIQFPCSRHARSESESSSFFVICALPFPSGAQSWSGLAHCRILKEVSLRLQSRFYFRVFFSHASCLVEKPRPSAAVSTQTSTGGRRPCTTRGALLRRDRTESEGGIRHPDLGPRRQDTPGKNGRWVLSFGV